MGVMSKQLFDEMFGGRASCKKLHWAFDESCMKFIWTFYRNSFIGCVKFFFPLSVLQICLNYKHLKGKLVSEFVKTFLSRTSIYTACCFLLFSWSCLLSNVFGGVGFYEIAFMPGFLVTFFMLTGPRKARIFDAFLCFNMVVEVIIKRAQYHDILKVTDTRLTLMFVLNNALLIYLLSHRNKEEKMSSIFWFYVPPSVQDRKLQSFHKTQYLEYCLEGVMKYFLFGYSWNIIRCIIRNNLSPLRQPQLLAQILKSRKNLNFGFFLSTYVGVNRAIMCYLCGRRNFSPIYSSIIAGLLSGLSFRIQPNTQLFCLGITTSLQLIYAKLEQKFTLLQKIPTIFPLLLICNGLICHERIVAPDICPKYFMNLTSLITCGQVDNLCKTMFQNGLTSIQ